MNLKIKVIHNIFCLFVALSTVYVSFFNYTDSEAVPATILGLAGTMKCKIFTLCILYLFILVVYYLIRSICFNKEEELGQKLREICRKNFRPKD